MSNCEDGFGSTSPITTYHNISQHITTYHNISQHITTYHNISQHITTYHNISQHITTYHNISQHITTYHNISQHITTYHNHLLKASMLVRPLSTFHLINSIISRLHCTQKKCCEESGGWPAILGSGPQACYLF